MNPSGQPFPSQFGAPPPTGGTGGGGAREAMNVPGILFIVFGSIGVLFALSSLVTGGGDMSQLNQALNDPNLPPEARDFLRALAKGLSGPAPKVLNLISAVMSAVMVFGGVQMRNLKNYGLAMATCIIGIIPMCGGCSCCVTLPLGIWVLTILMRPEIKASFT